MGIEKGILESTICDALGRNPVRIKRTHFFSIVKRFEINIRYKRYKTNTVEIKDFKNSKTEEKKQLIFQIIELMQ